MKVPTLCILISPFNSRTSFLTTPKPDRQAKLFEEFGFRCECKACMEDYPTSQRLVCRDKRLLKFAKKADEEVFQQQEGHAMKRYCETCEIIEKNPLNFPSIELCVLQKYMAKFLLLKARPLVLFS